MSRSADGALAPSEGLGVLHLFCRWRGPVDVAGVEAAEKHLVHEGGQLVTVAILGHKADVGFLALAPDQWALWDFQRACATAGLDIVSSYVSLTEVSEYA